MKRRLIELARRATRLLDLFPLTFLGTMAATASWAALELFAFTQMDLVLLVVGYAMAGLCALCAALVAAAALWLKRHSRDPGQETERQLETGTASRTGYWFPSLRWVPLLQVRWAWESPRGWAIEIERDAGRSWEVAIAGDRGQIRQVRRRLVVQDALGISRIALRFRKDAHFDVLPRLGGLERMNALLSMAGGEDLPHPAGVDDGDRMELRRYLPGDPARFIHWKVLARTRKLMVRVPERALSSARRTAAFIVAGEGDDASAAAARAALRSGMLGDEGRFGSDLEIAGASDLPEALGVLMRSGEARDRQGAGLGAFVEAAEQRGPSSLLVFAPPSPGEWMGRVLEVARRRRVHLIIAADLDPPGPPPRWWQRLLLSGRTETGVAIERLRDIAQAVQHPNCKLTLLERDTGRPLRL